MKRYIKVIDLVVLFETTVAVLLYLVLYNAAFSNFSSTIYVLSVLGWIELVFCFISMKRKCGKFFTLYSIFMGFAFLFTYGQCLLWAFGIHLDHEISNTRLYRLGFPTEESIIRAQMLTLTGLQVFHCGALLAFRKKAVQERALSDRFFSAGNKSALLKASWICNLVSTPFMVYSILRSIAINRVYGYGATLNNAEVVATQNNLIMLIRLMYIPSLFGILIASDYKKWSVRFCYLSFFAYMIISMLAGDRGEWLFPLFFLVWMHHRFYKPIRARSLAAYLLLGLLFVTVSVGIRESRSAGVTISGFAEALVGSENPIISAVFEMGSSMRPTVVLTQYGWNNYPYGNSYLLAIVGMITERPLRALIPGYQSLSSWFSGSFLGINYGAGFSFLAEAFSNFGPYLFLAAMFIIGVLFSKFMFFAESIDNSNRPVLIFFAMATANSMILSIRNTMLVSLKYWAYSTLPILAVCYFLYALTAKKRASAYRVGVRIRE